METFNDYIFIFNIKIKNIKFLKKYKEIRFQKLYFKKSAKKYFDFKLQE